MKYTFTKEELTLIERLVDNQTQECAASMTQYCQIAEKNKKLKKFVDDNFSKWVMGWDKLRMISAKCGAMKGEIKKIPKITSPIPLEVRNDETTNKEKVF